MFNPFKKSKNSTEETAQQKALRDTALDKVLLGYHVNNTSLARMVTGLERQGTVVTLNLRLPHDANPEQIHHDISEQLHLHGITEVNLNVSMQAPKANTANNPASQASAKASAKTLPKTSDAMTSNAASSGVVPAKTMATDAMANSKKQAAANAATGTSQEAHEPAPTRQAPKQSDIAPHPRITHILVVASGKGGVGKSTTTVNLALALKKLGRRVGVLDADIYGPSLPSMLGVEGLKPELENEQFVPLEAQGMPMLSIGSLLDTESTPVAWRGPKATGALMQLYNQTNWPNLDYLIIDMPPGTGDIQLTLAQRIPVTGAVIVTTPQHIALMDAKKGIEMFNKTRIPVLGVVENMALHTCSECGHTEAIFGTGGGDAVAEQYQVPLLGQLPLASGIRAQADMGVPSVVANEGAGDEFASFYIHIAKNIEANIEKFAKAHDDARIF